MSISERVGVAVGGTGNITTKPTGTQREQYAIARKELDLWIGILKQRAEKDVKEMESLLEKLGAPWTPGRLPMGR